jgi:hypothetical protein
MMPHVLLEVGLSTCRECCIREVGVATIGVHCAGVSPE